MYQTANLVPTPDSATLSSSAENGYGRSLPPTHDPSSWVDMLAEYDYPRPTQGEILYGEIIRIQDDALFINVGAKRDAIVPHDELNVLSADYLDSLAQGDTVPVYVNRTPFGNQELIVSLDKGLQALDWERAEAVMAAEESLELTVVGHNKGGLLLEFGRLRGFVPNSHDPDLRRLHDQKQQMSRRQQKVGDRLTVQIIEIDQQRQRLVMSATVAQQELRRAQLQAMEVGQVVTGEVVNLAPYGAFVSLGHVSGLLHISKICWENIDHPAEKVQVGDEIEVRVDKIDIERERLSLNRKSLLPDPWQQFAADHEVNGLLDGVVTAVTDFGAFVQVADQIEGLVHISEIENQYLERPDSVVQVGDAVLVRILSIDPDRRRLGLSMRRVSDQEEMAWMLSRRSPTEDEAPQMEVSPT